MAIDDLEVTRKSLWPLSIEKKATRDNPVVESAEFAFSVRQRLALMYRTG